MLSRSLQRPGGHCDADDDGGAVVDDDDGHGDGVWDCDGHGALEKEVEWQFWRVEKNKLMVMVVIVFFGKFEKHQSC